MTDLRAQVVEAIAQAMTSLYAAAEPGSLSFDRIAEAALDAALDVLGEWTRTEYQETAKVNPYANSYSALALVSLLRAGKGSE